MEPLGVSGACLTGKMPGFHVTQPTASTVKAVNGTRAAKITDETSSVNYWSTTWLL